MTHPERSRHTPTGASGVVDTLLDRSVLLGFSRVGPAVRRRLPGWPVDPEPGSLAGRHVAVTGSTSGLGTAAALGALRLGAYVHLIVRDEVKGARVRAELIAAAPNADVSVHLCDVGDLDDVRRFAAGFVDAVPTLDVLIHNAGVMPAERTESRQGHELSMAVHLLGPVLMTELLLPSLSGHDARVVFVTSGGMYAQRLRDDDPEYLVGDYSPTTAYARSKRAQVELLTLLQARWRSAGIRVYATHPGWASTPGVTESLPTFEKVMGPLLRDADGGAETTVWLSAVQPAPRSGGLWHDRRERPLHMRAKTRPSARAVQAMRDWVCSATGLA